MVWRRIAGSAAPGRASKAVAVHGLTAAEGPVVRRIGPLTSASWYQSPSTRPLFQCCRRCRRFRCRTCGPCRPCSTGTVLAVLVADDLAAVDHVVAVAVHTALVRIGSTGRQGCGQHAHAAEHDRAGPQRVASSPPSVPTPPFTAGTAGCVAGGSLLGRGLSSSATAPSVFVGGRRRRSGQLATHTAPRAASDSLPLQSLCASWNDLCARLGDLLRYGVRSPGDGRAGGGAREQVRGWTRLC